MFIISKIYLYLCILFIYFTIQRRISFFLFNLLDVDKIIILLINKREIKFLKKIDFMMIFISFSKSADTKLEQENRDVKKRISFFLFNLLYVDNIIILLFNKQEISFLRKLTL